MTSRAAAAEKERDEALADKQLAYEAATTNKRLHQEALAYAEKLKRALEFVMGCYDEQGEIHDFQLDTGKEALSVPVPAALSHLRQEIRREAFEEAKDAIRGEKLNEPITESDQAYDMALDHAVLAVSELAEQEKQG